MTHTHLDVADAKRRIKAIFVGSMGNLVEWYDFYAYTAFALYFAPAFFPRTIPSSSSSMPPRCSRPASSCDRWAAGCSGISRTGTAGGCR